MTHHLYVLRHAKSSWDDASLQDFDRPLSAQGQHDLPIICKAFLGQHIRPQSVLTSPALRAKTTASAMHKALALPSEALKEDHRIYGASADELIRILRQTAPSVRCLMLTGHNPGLTELINTLGDKQLANLPTCAWVLLALDIADWTEVSAGCGRWLHHDRPKYHR